MSADAYAATAADAPALRHELQGYQVELGLPQVPALLAVASPDAAGGRCLVVLLEGGALGTVAAG